MRKHQVSSKMQMSIAASAIMTVVLAASPVFAQQTSAPAGRLEKYDGDFRASSLIGATVYSDKGDTVGTVNDILTDGTGKLDKVILSVGGFLGIGSKYVAVTFDQLKIEPTPAPTLPSTAVTTGAAAPAAVGTGAVTTTPAVAPTPPAAGDAPAGAGKETAYYSLVMPGATKDTITSMPEFKYTT